jgi:PleD family two-component response regulator
LVINNNNSCINKEEDSTKTIQDSTEVIIQRTVEGIKKLLNPQYENTTPEEEAAAAIKVNPVIKKYAELKIKILQDSPRDAEKLSKILQAKQKEYRKAQDSDIIERLITEIDVLEYLLFLVNNGRPQTDSANF